MPRKPRPRSARSSASPRRRVLDPAAASRRQTERDQARTKILAAATYLFAHKGIENVTFGDVARRAKSSRPLVYFYFPDLRTLVLEASHVAARRLQERMVAAVGSTRTGLDAILALGRSYVAYHEAEPENFFVCMVPVNPSRNGKRPTELEERILSVERAMMGMVEAAVARGVRDGSVRPDLGETLTVAMSLWAFVQGLVQLSTGHRDTIERFFGLGLERFLDAGFKTLSAALAAPR
ncbi:MAG TPA: TetR/AcrR family transcriptional regulator [Verrucomicrobiota bacterium]|nr:TetR/AcrR family transcriptional regulator [Verrucomicrobiota bacterium]